MTTNLTPEALADLAAVGITRDDQLEVVEAVADEVLVRASLAVSPRSRHGWQSYRGQLPFEEWVQKDGPELVSAPIQGDGTVKITREAFAALMGRAGFVRIAEVEA